MPKQRKKQSKYVITERIKYEYGSIQRFCRLHDINPSTFKQVIYLGGTSEPLYQKLKKSGMAKSRDEIGKKVENDN